MNLQHVLFFFRLCKNYRGNQYQLPARQGPRSSLQEPYSREDFWANCFMTSPEICLKLTSNGIGFKAVCHF